MPTSLFFDDIRNKIDQLIIECREKQSIEKSLLEYEQRYRLMNEAIDQPVIVAQNNQIKESNRKLTEISGYSSEEISQLPFSSLIFKRDQKKDETDTLNTETDEPTVFHTNLRKKNGDILNVHAQKFHLTYGNEPADLFVINNPISPSHLENIRNLESIAALSGGIAHDYNNLLTVIIGNLSLALSSLSEKNILLSLIKEAIQASNIAKELTQRLITFSKGGSPLKKHVHIEKLIRQSVEFALSGSNVKCEYHFPKSLPPVEVDKVQIGQAVHHIITNAIESMPDGGIVRIAVKTITILVDGLDLPSGEYVMISIKDNGSGISPSIMDKIFTPYFSTKERGSQKGMGLGLSIALSIVKKHGGTIDVQSHKEKGAEFSLYLPAAKNIEQKTEPNVGISAGKEMSPIKGMGRILLMDDEAMVRELACNILNHLGYEVELAKDGKECIQLFLSAEEEKRPFDLLILDLTIRGGMGGKETIKEIKKIRQNVKCIVSSGYSTDPVLSDHLKYGFDGAIPKPYNVYQLSKEIHDIFNAS